MSKQQESFLPPRMAVSEPASRLRQGHARDGQGLWRGFVPTRTPTARGGSAAAARHLETDRGDTDAPDTPPRSFRYRTIWISDIHLGTRNCQAARLLDFLRATECETLYLVGDIVDCWRLRRAWHWPQAHNDVVQKLLRKARKGTRVVYIPGNHDDVLRDYAGLQCGGIQIETECIHVTADGRRLLVLHGDQFDGVMQHARWLAFVGDWAYDAALSLNGVFNRVRCRFGRPYWSLSAYLKHRVKNAVAFISQYEDAIAFEARRRDVDGIVCGHIHHAEIRRMGDVLYCNDGDWVESCTALAEHFDGRLELIRWTEPAYAAETAAEPVGP